MASPAERESREAKVCRLGVLMSGRGSNFAAIQAAIKAGALPNAEIAVVIANHAEAAGLVFAQAQGLPTAVFEKSDYASRTEMDQAIADRLNASGVEVIILAGYDRILGQPLLAGWPGRILNIHPSLLPAYGGKGMVGHHVHAAVLANREARSGCSVHLVTDVVDGGQILGQADVPVLPDDTPETLADRVLAQEHQLYPRVIRDFIENLMNASQVGKGTGTHERNALV